MARQIRIGDIFEVELGEHRGYFQYVANDSTELESPVIRAFMKRYRKTDTPIIDEIPNDAVDFCTHSFVKTGIKLGLWAKVGTSSQLGDIHIPFRSSRDYGVRKVEVSHDWEVWKVNGPRLQVGELPREFENAEIGGVNPPYLVVERMKLGHWTFSYPRAEPTSDV